MSNNNFDFNSILGIGVYKLERSLGPHIKFVGLCNEKNDIIYSYEHWIEIDGIKIPSSIGYSRTREEFEKKMEGSALKFFEEIIGEIAPLMIKASTIKGQ